VLGRPARSDHSTPTDTTIKSESTMPMVMSLGQERFDLINEAEGLASDCELTS